VPRIKPFAVNFPNLPPSQMVPRPTIFFFLVTPIAENFFGFPLEWLSLIDVALSFQLISLDVTLFF